MYDAAAELFVTAFLFAYTLSFAGLVYWTVRIWARSGTVKGADVDVAVVAQSTRPRPAFATPNASH